MQQLNLPDTDVKLRRNQDGSMQVFDPLRGKWLVLTPEEWVRQNFVGYLVSYLGYPRGRMGNEVSLRLNGNLRRCDTIIFDRSGNPLAVVEYKAPEVDITAEVFNQILRYNSVIRAPFLIVSNGLRHFCCRATFSPLSCTFLRNIPTWNDLENYPEPHAP